MKSVAHTVCLLLALIGCPLGSQPTAVAEDYKLQPLAYNNPDLVVDLGVGLWAYPMPLDYDGDGDMDLLVSCPDKPSNGTYLFENPSQDPQESMPVFKPAVRLGQGHHYMLLSQVQDEAVLLRPGYEYRRNSETGEYDFENPTKIPAVENPHRQIGGGRTRGNMWRYVDYDGDGDQDIAVGIGDWSDLAWDHAYDSQGRWRNGPLHGYVYLMRNEGTDAAPKYSRSPHRLSAGGGDIDVYGWPCPNFADFDGDGDLDLLCGEFLDGFTYFSNVGQRQAPAYAGGQRLLAEDGTPLRMHLQMITPTAVDWDRDGDLDLIVGDEDGRVAWIENTGSLRDNAPLFKQPVYFQQQADTLKFGALATPYAYDWDGDGDEDIVCGNTAGSIGWFENLGRTEAGQLRWAAPQVLHVPASEAPSGTAPFRIQAGPNGSIQGPCEAEWGYTTLSVTDWDQDGDGDIVYNSILARVELLIQQDGLLHPAALDTGVLEYPPAWNWSQHPSNATLTQWRTTPLALDFDGDQQLDLVLLDQEGYLTLRRSCQSAERIFVDEDHQPLRLNAGTCGRSGRTKLAMVDWDGDSRLDLLVNSENATWYRNCGERDGRVVLKRVGNLARRNVAGHTSSPAVCDFDQDGRPDLLVGSENGRIYHIAHADCATFSESDLQARPEQERTEQRVNGLESEEFLFGKAPFAECHAATICETSRGLVAAWFGGTREGQDDVGIWVSYHDGLRWNGPHLVADGVQHEGLRYPCWNPVLFQPPGDAPTLLFFKVGPNPREWWGEMMVSYDRGRTFRDRRRLPETIDGPVRSKPVLLNGNRLLCGSSTESDGWRVHFESVPLSQGQPHQRWQRVDPINEPDEFNAIQPTFLQHKDRLQVLCRTKEGVIASSFSVDNGQTWSALQSIDLPNPNSGIEAQTLRDGRHLLVYNPLGTGSTQWGKRSTLSIALSDDGLKWKKIGDLEHEAKGEFSYPAAIQAADGRVHVLYTWQRDKIKHVVLDPSAWQSSEAPGQ